MCIRGSNYVGILRAAANGQQTLGEIGQRTGLDGSKASFYPVSYTHLTLPTSALVQI